MDAALLWALCALAALVVAALALFRRAPAPDLSPVIGALAAIKADVERLDRTLREDSDRTDQRLRAIGDGVRVQAAEGEQRLKEALDGFGSHLRAMADSLNLRLDAHRAGLDDAAKSLREELARQLTALREENSQKLEQMRHTVDEKLQGTLEARLGESFKQVSERLEQVHRGLGEMQVLAGGVGDLSRVLTNVKTRGTWGEVQLGNLLDQVLSPDQYFREKVIKQNSSERVDVAVRFPGRGPGEPEVLLPIDAKFPREDYERLVDAAERADADAVDREGRNFETRLKKSAAEIQAKYISPPDTTDFALMFLPTEGLYAEALRRPGLADTLQRDYRVILSGPTTLLALLNSLQMGFRTLAIEKRSSEVWKILGAVKTEFTNYGSILDKVKKKLDEAGNTIDQVGVRQRAITRKLQSVESLSEPAAGLLLGLAADPAVVDDEA